MNGSTRLSYYKYTIEVKNLHIYFFTSILCVCVYQTIDGDLRVVLDGSSFWTDWHHCILYSTHHSSLPEKKHNYNNYY